MSDINDIPKTNHEIALEFEKTINPDARTSTPEEEAARLAICLTCDQYLQHVNMCDDEDMPMPLTAHHRISTHKCPKGLW